MYYSRVSGRAQPKGKTKPGEAETSPGDFAQITAAGVRKYLMPAFAEIPEEEEGLTLKEATDQFQYNLIKTALIRYGSTYKAAAALGTSQSTLSRKARQLGIQVTTELCGE